jgi:thymidylate synthase ThyX
MTTSAKIICDSISEQGVRITTLELEFERFLLAQFNTHRMFSRSAQSSRAVPFDKLRESVKKSPVPDFSKNQSGMQAGEKLTGFELTRCKEYWEQTKRECLYFASGLADAGVHKQWVNRLLEPFSTVKVVVTATEWNNFFALRLDHAAQPEMFLLAQAMKDAMDESKPQKLEVGEWHLPYIATADSGRSNELPLISAARCARVSYLNHDNSTPDIKKDLGLARRLLADGHYSPLEHQATPMDFNTDTFVNGQTHTDIGGFKWSGNFREWLQFRHLI